MGNTRDTTPTPLQRDLSPHVREQLESFPDTNKPRGRASDEKENAERSRPPENYEQIKFAERSNG